MPVTAATLTELQTLVARLEKSGLADQRPEAAALLERCRGLLAAAPAPSAQPPRPRPRPARRQRVARRVKLGRMLLVLLDLGAAGIAAGAVTALLIVGPALPRLTVLALPVAWLLLRWASLPGLLGEAWFRLVYALRFGWLWLAEAFSASAFARFQVLLDARDVMRGWRAWRRDLSGPPRMADAEAYLAASYGSRAAELFRLAAEARPADGPLESQRPCWSRLIRLFEGLAAQEEFWAPATPPTPHGITAPPPVVVTAEPPEPPERIARKQELKELILARRADIQRAQDWKMKTPAELEQRDRHLAKLRQEHDELEAELRSLGGVPPPLISRKRR